MNDKELRHEQHNKAVAQFLASQTTLMRMLGGLSQKELAARAGVSVATVRRVEEARFNGSPHLLAKIASVFDVAIEVRFEPWSEQVPKSYAQTMDELKTNEASAIRTGRNPAAGRMQL